MSVPVATHALTTTPDLLEAFLAQVKARPTVTAVDDGFATVTYGELALRARLIAGSIHGAVPVATPRVLIALPQGASSYASMVGCLMAGGTFCTIHFAGPEGRNAGICQAFSPDIIFHEGPPPSFLDVAPITTPRLDLRLLQEGQAALDAPADEFSEVAYVAFTSGSTGSPKGVKVGRLALSHFLEVGRSYFQLRVGERWGQFSNLGHDLGIMDVFMALAWGGTLVPLNEAEHLRPATAIKDKPISVWQSVPSIVELMRCANHLTTEYLSSLRVMSFCGEALHTHQLEILFKACPPHRSCGSRGVLPGSTAATDGLESVPDGLHVPVRPRGRRLRRLYRWQALPDGDRVRRCRKAGGLESARIQDCSSPI